jgi:MYXO-CTERM domain-containing protein
MQNRLHNDGSAAAESPVNNRTQRSMRSRAALTVGAVALGALLGLGAAPRAGAQTPAPVTLTLTPAVTVVAPGTQNVTFTLDLTGGTDIFAYNTTITLNNTYLTFTSTTPFVSTFSGFDLMVANTVTGGNSLNVSYAAFNNPSVNNTNSTTGLPLTTALGYFTANVSATAPTGLTAIALSGISSAANGSDVIDQTTQANELTAVAGSAVTVASAPEPSQDAALGVGLLGLGALALTARRRAASARK